MRQKTKKGRDVPNGKNGGGKNHAKTHQEQKAHCQENGIISDCAAGKIRQSNTDFIENLEDMVKETREIKKRKNNSENLAEDLSTKKQNTYLKGKSATRTREMWLTHS